MDLTKEIDRELEGIAPLGLEEWEESKVWRCGVDTFSVNGEPLHRVTLRGEWCTCVGSFEEAVARRALVIALGGTPTASAPFSMPLHDLLDEARKRGWRAGRITIDGRLIEEYPL